MATGTGTVYERQDGRWVAAIRLPGGKRVSRYAKSEREARRLLLDLQREYTLGTLQPPAGLTVAQWLEEWLEQKAGELRPKSVATYKHALGAITPIIGALKMSRLTPAALTAAFVRMRRDGTGTRVVQQAYVYLHAALADAVRLGVLGVNPLDRVTKPAHQQGERRYWTLAEMRAFVAHTESSDTQYAPLLEFMLGSGVRIGEALAMRWSDIDMEKGTVTVKRAITFIDTTPTPTAPKSAAGARVISLTDITLRALARLPRPLDADTPIFQSSAGTLPTKGNPNRALRALCKGAGVPLLSAHGLRHVHAAVVAAAGVDVHSLRKRLGHARASTTMNAYCYHVQQDDLTARAFDNMLAGD